MFHYHKHFSHLASRSYLKKIIANLWKLLSNLWSGWFKWQSQFHGSITSTTFLFESWSFTVFTVFFGTPAPSSILTISFIEKFLKHLGQDILHHPEFLAFWTLSLRQLLRFCIMMKNVKEAVQACLEALKELSWNRESCDSFLSLNDLMVIVVLFLGCLQG